MSNTANSSLNRTASAFDRFTGVVKKAAAAFAAFVTIRQAVNLFSSFVGKIIEVDRAFRGFIASMSIIRGSTQAAVKEYEFLYSISNKLGVQVETSISQYHRLAASLKNVDASGELARHIFSGISQAALVLHARGRDVTLIFEAIQQMASKGKLSLEELQRQLGNTLPGAVSMAARAMMQSKGYIEAGITTAVEAERKLREQIQKGTINVYEFLTLLAQQLKTEYGQGVEYASQQFTANLNRMRNTVYEFFRTVGDSGATQGLTKIIQSITGLFDNTAGSAKEFGKVLGDIFTDVADWISDLDASDVQEFFLSVQAVTLSTWAVLEEFLKIFARFTSSEVNSPLLGFAEFVAKTMAAVVDVFNVAVAGIEAAIRSLMAIFLELRSAFGWAMDGIATARNAIVQAIPGMPGKESAQAQQELWRGFRERWNQSASNNASAAGRAYGMFFKGPEQSAYDRVSEQFDAIRNRNMPTIPGYQPWTLAQAVYPKPQTTVAANGMPSFLLVNQGNETKSPAEDYINPLSPEGLEALMERILANSGAPNAEGGGKGKGKGKGKSAEAELRRQIREFESLENAVSRWRVEAGITERTTEKLARAKDQLTEAVGKLHPVTGELLLTQEEADEILTRMAEKYSKVDDAVADLIDEMEFENSLIGKSLEEQQKMIMLRQAGADATEEQRKAIIRLVEEGLRAREVEADMHLLHDGAKDLFRTIITDSSRATDALNRFFDNLKARAADKLFEGLLAGFAGMSGGGGWSGFMQGFGKGWSGPPGLAGARAAGGPVMAGSTYLVGEQGPELFVPKQHGQIVPAGKWVVGGGNVQVQVNNYTGGQVRTREERTRGPDGTELHRLIVDVVADDLANGGKSAAVLRNRYGLREATS